MTSLPPKLSQAYDAVTEQRAQNPSLPLAVCAKKAGVLLSNYYRAKKLLDGEAATRKAIRAKTKTTKTTRMAKATGTGVLQEVSVLDSKTARQPFVVLICQSPAQAADVLRSVFSSQ